ncbi:MAG: 3-deoxy-D-manno-octulosonic acid transferase [Acidobacteria bacterium]|uniref:3-deoxy-D-manno-octulosonic acid transferase n=1 Tax=Candidatus Polarisedimenticola svalbardensis TaxID=2886004 RepID=A0A8J6XSD5_9BACT|nr:3-deoxy-D-manno-octulosonic acid transferase [Candidatus Polarisedimenticola svalbardensis]
MHTLYNILLVPVRWLTSLASFRFRRDRDRSAEWSERRVRTVPDIRPGGLWIHGASVGEVRIVASLAAAVRQIQPNRPLAASAYTRTGRASLPGPPALDATFFMPLDLPGYPSRLLDGLQPAALVLVETELWPNLIRETTSRRIPVVMVNGRLSPKRMRQYRRYGALYRPLLQSLTAVGVQSEEDAGRFMELGVHHDQIVVTGNIKYDLPRPATDPSALAARIGLSRDRPVLVAGSTGPGEEPIVTEAFLELRRHHPNAFLILAPRHPERSEGVYREAATAGLKLRRLSQAAAENNEDIDGLLVDTLGELTTLYTLADAAFVGGSLIPVGGHNVLEPAAAGVPVLFGPHTEHFREPAQALVDAGGGSVVTDAAELARAFRNYLEQPDRARAAGAAAGRVVAANRGALARSVELVLKAAPPGSAS